MIQTILAGLLSTVLALGGGYVWGARATAAHRDDFWKASIEKVSHDAAETKAGLIQAYREVEAKLAAQKQEASDELAKERAAGAGVAAALRAARVERDGLRDQIGAFAKGGPGGAADDSVAACRDRAETLGVLLDGALQASEKLAGDAEDESAKLRAVRAAWPTLKDPK